MRILCFDRPTRPCIRLSWRAAIASTSSIPHKISLFAAGMRIWSTFGGRWRRGSLFSFQPKVNMRTGVVVGAEALLRWQHPERGILPPGMFLPLIEEHPLAIELGEWVIDSALSQIEVWGAAGLDMPVSVNVGALQLQQPDFVDRLASLLAAHPSVKPSSLELEVLETSALQDVVQTSQVLNACHGIGVSFALDDFGTGYSSLTLPEAACPPAF